MYVAGRAVCNFFYSRAASKQQEREAASAQWQPQDRLHRRDRWKSLTFRREVYNCLPHLYFARESLHLNRSLLSCALRRAHRSVRGARAPPCVARSSHPSASPFPSRPQHSSLPIRIHNLASESRDGSSWCQSECLRCGAEGWQLRGRQAVAPGSSAALETTRSRAPGLSRPQVFAARATQQAPSQQPSDTQGAVAR